MENAPAASEVDSSLLITLSLGLGSLGVVFAGVTVFLLLRNNDAFSKARYRSNRSTGAPVEMPREQNPN